MGLFYQELFLCKFLFLFHLVNTASYSQTYYDSVVFKEAGSSFTFSCGSDNDNKNNNNNNNSKYQWIHLGFSSFTDELVNNQLFDQRSQISDQYDLHVENAEIMHAGFFKCRVEDTDGVEKWTTTHKLIVVYTDKMKLNAGKDGVIRVVANVSYVADEIPKPKLRLRFTNENQSYEEMNCISRLSHHTECHLEIRYHTHEQVPSVYSIIFDNGKRELFKQEKLFLAKETKHRYLSKGEPFSESCESPPSSPIQWSFYGTPITQNTSAAAVGKNNYSMITGNAISIESVGPVNAGTYVCFYKHNPHVYLKNNSLSIIDKTRISFQPTHNNVTLEMWITYAGSDSSPPALFQCASSNRSITMNNTRCIYGEVGEGNCYLKHIIDFAAKRCFIILGDFYFEEEFKTDVKVAENGLPGYVIIFIIIIISIVAVLCILGCIIKRGNGIRKRISKILRLDPQCPDIIHDPKSTSGSPPIQVFKDSSFNRGLRDISLAKMEAGGFDLKEDTKTDTIGQSAVVTAKNSVANQDAIGNEAISLSSYPSSVFCENIERNSEEIERSKSNDELSKLMV